MKIDLKNPNSKRQGNVHIFNIVAPKYHLITRVLSFFRDTSWKKAMINTLPPLKNPVALDVASGSGDIALGIRKKYISSTVLGIDLTRAMLPVKRYNGTDNSLGFAVQDMNLLGIQDESIDIITGSYALRNAPHLSTTLKEINRVLKIGGYAAFLDFSKPKSKFFSAIELSLLHLWCGLWSFVFHQKLFVYTYIPKSLHAFPNRPELKNILEHHGFQYRKRKLFFFGVIEMIVCQKGE